MSWTHRSDKSDDSETVVPVLPGNPFEITTTGARDASPAALLCARDPDDDGDEDDLDYFYDDDDDDFDDDLDDDFEDDDFDDDDEDLEDEDL